MSAALLNLTCARLAARVLLHLIGKKGKGKGKYSGWTCDVKALDYINWTKMDLDACCDGEFNSCENGEESYVVPGCAMQKQQCEDQRSISLAQVA